jgi:hypothetical protein
MRGTNGAVYVERCARIERVGRCQAAMIAGQWSHASIAAATVSVDAGQARRHVRPVGRSSPGEIGSWNLGKLSMSSSVGRSEMTTITTHLAMGHAGSAG